MQFNYNHVFVCTVAVDWNDIERELLQRVLLRLGCPLSAVAERTTQPPLESSSNLHSSPIVVEVALAVPLPVPMPIVSDSKGEKESLSSGSRCMWCQEVKVTFKRVGQGKRIVCSTCYDKKIMLLS